MAAMKLRCVSLAAALLAATAPAARPFDEATEVVPTDTELQRRLAGSGAALRVRTSEDGLYRIPLGEIERAGLPIEDPEGLGVFWGGHEIPSHLEKDALFFYGRRTPYAFADNERFPRHSAENVYWIARPEPDAGEDTRAALRMEARPAVGASRESFRELSEELLLEENEVYHPMRHGEGVDRWSWKMLVPGGEPFAVRAELPGLVSKNGKARFEVVVHGVAQDDSTSFALEVRAGDRPLARDEWKGGAAHSVLFEAAAGFAEGGIEVLHKAGPGIMLDRIRIEYFSRPQARDGRLAFRLPRAGKVRVQDVGSASPVGVEATDPDRPVWLEGMGTEPEISTAGREGGRFYVARPDRCLVPAAIEKDRPSDLHGAPPADYVVVAPARFLEALAPLVAHRKAEGLSVLVAELQDVYDEFSAGVVHPGAIRAFLAHEMRASEGNRPRSALLAGDWTAKPLGDPEGAVLPVHWTEGEFFHEVASDAWYVCLDDAGRRPQIALGRIPARTPEEVALVVEKTLRYEKGSGDWTRRAFLVAGDEDQFREATDELAKLFPSGRDLVKDYQGVEPDPGGTAVRAWTEGLGVVHYFGHGTVLGWGRRGNLLSGETAASLANGEKTPVVFTLNCLNAAFAHPKQRSFAEAVLFAPAGGAVAFVGSTSACLPEPQYRLHRLLYPSALAQGGPRLGEALVRSLSEFFDPAKAEGDLDVIRSWVLLGDPALRVR
ncbi:MAG: hypothetical protein HY720_15170 [Planctomycetes bacterium]|nr:hypothetical protein [Planctomycetota bacterium]